MEPDVTEPTVVSSVVDLLEEFHGPTTTIVSCNDAEDFLTLALDACCVKSDTHRETVARLFFLVVDNEKFLDIVSEAFFKQSKRRGRFDDKNIVNVMVYLLLLQLNELTLVNVKNSLLHLHPLKAFHLLQFLTTEDVLTTITMIGCQVFDLDFVKERLVKPLEPKDSLVKRMLKMVCSYLRSVKRSKKASPTRPVGMTVHSYNKGRRKLIAPTCTPAEPQTLEVKPPPATTYKAPDTELRLAEMREANRREAQKRLEEAQHLAFRCAAPRSPKSSPTRDVQPVQPSKEPYKAAPPPDFSKVTMPVKGTATTVLREAARLRQEEKKDMQRLEAMISGGGNYLVIEQLEAEIREKREQEQLEAVERKHLQGLLSREEALLAKQRLQKMQQERMVAFKQERELWERRLEEFRASEQRKIQHLVDKSQRIKQAARDRFKEAQEHKRQTAQEANRQAKAILEQAGKEKEDELSRRIELIRELRALQGLRRLRTKEFDSTETPGLGLLCEMSIAELRERLMIARVDLHDQLEQRRARTRTLRANQRRLVEDTEEFIRQHRNAKKPEDKVRNAPRARPTEELRLLRQRLEETRQLRATF